MKLASLKTGGRDGSLIVVARDLKSYRVVPDIAPSLQSVLERWDDVFEQLNEIYIQLNEGTTGKTLMVSELASPLPRAYQWLDGSAYLSHVQRVRKARGAEMPESFLTDPLMYQGGSDYFLSPTDDIVLSNVEWGLDFESEVAVITDDVPIGTQSQNAEPHIKLLMLVNDISLRGLIPNELGKGFGFIHGKPPTAFSPVAVTPDEVSAHWQECKLNLSLQTHYNEVSFGHPDAGVDMQFSFAELIQHAAKSRPLTAGTIIGSGTVSNNDESRGCSCLVEKRVLEVVKEGKATTPFMKVGDSIRIDMVDALGHSVFGAIEQRVVEGRS
ncbi:Fumarylacetoacetase [hydrothermal vent metagenome]|uniref:Fumarylacetoacetase n=1 Tax=hydrothermal vent metagenome TaxID=652676 RepID=A0A3B0Z6S4_9ZZZZ